MQDELRSSEETAFVQDEVKSIVQESCESILSKATYSADKVPQYTNELIESILKRLTALQKPFKYIVSCIFTQKTGAGFHTASSAFWDSTTDGSAIVQYENNHLRVVVTVFGLAI
ncbi:hypothetical protein GEMRC1_009368 [Eukaryota sp. GEM-RC1]